MGMYDTVWVPCPECGEKSGFQTKSGPCLLREYELDAAPLDVLLDVNRHAPNQCEKCGTLFQVGSVGREGHCATCRCTTNMTVERLGRIP